MACGAAFVAGPKGREGLGRGSPVELGVAPSAAVGESLAVLHHEINIVQLAVHRRRRRRVFTLLRFPMDLRHSDAIGEMLAGGRKTGLIGGDHRGIAQDHFNQISGLADADGLPAFVSLEIGEPEPVGTFTEYLSCAARKTPPKAARSAALIAVARMRFLEMRNMMTFHSEAGEIPGTGSKPAKARGHWAK
jgi:hypothetical protein